MKRSEVAFMLGVIGAVYSSFGRGQDPERMVTIWHRYFEGYDPDIVMAAVDDLIKTSKYPPVIAEIRKKIDGGGVSPSDVLHEAQRLMNSGIAPDRADEAYAKMTPACVAAVKSAGGWYALSISHENDNRIEQAVIRGAAQYIEQHQAERLLGEEQLKEIGPGGEDHEC